MQKRTLTLAIGAAAMLLPVALVLAVFPTAMGDISENFASGRWFPLTTPEHPPLQVWITGLVALVFRPSALSAILVGQVLNALGVIYVYLTLARVVDETRARLFAFLFAGSIYFMGAPLSYALNADIIQIPIWAGVVYHLVRAAESDRWRHWIGFALWMVAAVYTKYSVAILVFGLGVGSLAVADYRRQWRNPRFLLACLATVVLSAPYFIALRSDPAAIGNAAIRVEGGTESLLGRFANLLRFVEGPFVFLAPGWIMIGLGLWRRDFVALRPSAAAGATARFLRWTFYGAVALVVAMIFGIGLFYVPRFDAPLFVLLVLAGAPLVEIDRERWRVVEGQVLFTVAAFAAVFFVGAVVAYTFFTSHDNMQEPFSQADAILRADWDKSFACGPAYYLGDRRTAHGLSIVGDLKPIGIPLEDIRKVDWFDPELLRERGALLVFSGEAFPADKVAAALPEFAAGQPKSFTLPLLRTLTGQRVGYSYAFIPPADCPAGGG